MRRHPVGETARRHEDEYSLIIIDPLYRFWPEGFSENDNAATTRIYNQIDAYASRLGAAFLVVHHAAKGSQAQKDITDVGAGAGSQSRAADTHIILRPHQNGNCHVLDAVTRSFPPVESIVLQWDFPGWIAVDGDPTQLKRPQTAGERRQEQQDDETDETVLNALSEPRSQRELRKVTGFSDDRLVRSRRRLLDRKLITVEHGTRRGKECEIIRRREE